MTWTNFVLLINVRFGRLVEVTSVKTTNHMSSITTDYISKISSLKASMRDNLMAECEKSLNDEVFASNWL